MCGIIGTLSFQNNNDLLLNKISNSLRFLSKRGPDFFDTYINNSKNLIFRHTRLSIRDLSNNSNQPMVSHNKILQLHIMEKFITLIICIINY